MRVHALTITHSLTSYPNSCQTAQLGCDALSYASPDSHTTSRPSHPPTNLHPLSSCQVNLHLLPQPCHSRGFAPTDLHPLWPRQVTSTDFITHAHSTRTQPHPRPVPQQDAIPCHPPQVTSTDFIITTSVDGHIKFWKKQPRGIEFVKQYRAHLGSVDGGLGAAAREKTAHTQGPCALT